MFCTLLCIYFASSGHISCSHKSNEKYIVKVTDSINKDPLDDDYWYGASTKCLKSLPKNEMDSLLDIISVNSCYGQN